ncbi:hypothetical protein HJC23_010376, partial [Cyclotella cryptica]
MNFRGLRFHIVALILFRGRLCSSFNNRPNCHASKTLSSTSLHAISTNDGFITITRSNGSRHQLSYRIARPMALSLETGRSHRDITRRCEREKENDVECLSAVLSSAPSDIPQLEKEFVRLTGKLTAADGTLSAELNELFRVNYQCRLDAMPEELAYAYANAGTVWSGTNAIANYVARPPPEDATRMPSALITR